MKKIQLIIVIALSLTVSSCAMFKNGNNDAEKQRMQVDAYAKADIDCEYRFAKIKYAEDRNNKKLKVQIDQLKEKSTAFNMHIYKRYGDVGELRNQFNNLYKTSKTDLTSCKKIVEYEQKITADKEQIKQTKTGKVDDKK